MGFLDMFSKAGPSSLLRLPSGSFTVDRTGRIIASTIPQNFPESLLHEIAGVVLHVFREAHKLEHPLNEMLIQYASLKLSARELRGGAIIFMTPQALGRK